MPERRDTKNRLLNRGEYQKPDGRYMYRYKDAIGKTNYVYSWTLTQSDRTPKGKPPGRCLRELEKEIARDVQDGIIQSKTKQTLNDFFDDYIMRKMTLKPRTVYEYRRRYDRYVRSTIGNLRMDKIRHSDVLNFYTGIIQNKSVTITTINSLQMILHPIFQYAVRDNYLRANPTEGVITEIRDRFVEAPRKKHALTIDEQKTLVNFVKKNKRYSRWGPMIIFLLGTGCRIGEALAITWSDCDFDNGVIHVTHNAVYYPATDSDGYGFHIGTPKTAAGHREIPMFKEVRDVLLEVKASQERNGVPEFEIDGYSGFVFPNCDNTTLITPGTFNENLHRIVKQYNKSEAKISTVEGREPFLLPNITAHTFRHTFCTRLCENESNLKIVQEIMGHKSITVTMDVYNEATRDKKKESFAALEGKVLVY